MILKWIFVGLALLASYTTLFSLVICPNHSNESTIIDFTIPILGDKGVDLTTLNQFISTNCHYISQLNHENVDKLVDDVSFNYKIHVAPYFSFFNQYYYPKYKLLVASYWDRVKIYYEYTVSPWIQYNLKVLEVKLSQLSSSSKLQLIKLKLLFINSNTYQAYTASEFHNKYVLVPYNKVRLMVSKFFENSNFQKINEKKTFLVNEFNNLIDLKFGTKKVDIDLKDIIEDLEEEGPITIRLTSTIYETGKSIEPISVETRSAVEIEIDDILDVFESKINKTVALALNNISNEINPIINKTIEDLQPKITEVFKTVQKTNYEMYKEAHQMIKRIDKDLSNLKEFGPENYQETVSRQDMRDMITKIKEYDASEVAKVEQLMNNKFGELVNTYLFIIQDTIDILETFMDSSFQDFQNKLSSELTFSDDEQYNWRVWKEYHGLKNKVLDRRDFIFDQAGFLRAKQFDKLSLENDFKNWLNFVTSLDFHLTYIVRDNDEYLSLIRAKANVSYQLREAEEANEAANEAKAELAVEPAQSAAPEVDESSVAPEEESESPETDSATASSASISSNTKTETIIVDSVPEHKANADSDPDSDVDFSDDPEVDFD